MKRLSILVAVFALVLASLACGASTTEKLQEAAEAPTPTTSVAEPTPVSDEGGEGEQEPTAPPEATDTPEPTEAPEPTDAPEPIDTPVPTESPMSEPEPLRIVDQGFGQDERDLGFAFLVENPNTDIAVENSQYQVALFDEGGVVLETDSGYIELILPGQTLGVASTAFLDEGVTASKIEVQLLEGDSVPADPIPSFEVESATYYVGDYSTDATGVISSPYNVDLESVRVSAVAYNEGGEIVGGGRTYLNFILANGSTGVEVPLSCTPDIASVELYPAISGLTFWGEEDERPEGALDIVLVEYGFGQDDLEVGIGMLIENPNDAFAVEGSQYRATAYSEDGRVLAAGEGTIEVVPPGRILGFAGDLWLASDIPIARLDVQIKSGEFVESEPVDTFTAENVAYQADDYFPKVTGQIINPYNKDITDVRVAAIAFDDAGKIIGGGYTYLDFAPANGKAAVEVSVTTAGVPSMVEMHATVSGLSEFEE